MQLPLKTNLDTSQKKQNNILQTMQLPSKTNLSTSQKNQKNVSQKNVFIFGETVSWTKKRKLPYKTPFSVPCCFVYIFFLETKATIPFLVT